MTSKRLEAIVRLWQHRLGLERWDIKIDWDTPCSDDAYAQVSRPSDYDRATVTLDSEWPGWEKKFGLAFVHRIVVHELLHLQTRGLDEAFKAGETRFHPEAWEVAKGRFYHEEEGLVDRLATRLVEMMGVE